MRLQEGVVFSLTIETPSEIALGTQILLLTSIHAEKA